MTLSLLLLLWILGAPALLGALALRALGLRWRDDGLGCLGWSWLCGCLALGGALFICVVLRIPPRLWFAAPLALGGVLWWGGRRRAAAVPAATAPAAARPRRGGAWAFWTVTALGVLFVVLQATAAASRPCVEGDEGNLWALKAKSLLVDWYGGCFVAAQHWNVHPDYPLLNPLLQAWVYAQAGGIVHFENRLPVQACVLALWLAAAAALRARVPGWPAAGLLLLLGCAQSFTWLCRAAYADGMVALGLLVALDGFLRHRGTGARRWGWLASLGAALALWAKNEAMLQFAAVAAAALAAALARRPRPALPSRRALAFLLPPLGVVAVQTIWNRSLGFHNDLLGANPTGRSMLALFGEQFAARAPVVAARAVALVCSPRRVYGVFAVLLLAPLCLPRAALGPRLLVPTLALLGSLVGLHLVYVGSWLDLEQHLRTSHERVLFQLVPATLVWCAALLRETLDTPRAALPAPSRVLSAP